MKLYTGRIVSILVALWLLLGGQTPKPNSTSRGQHPKPVPPACDSCEFRKESIVFMKDGQVVREIDGEVADIYRRRWPELGMLTYPTNQVMAINRSGQPLTIYCFERGVMVAETDVPPYILDWSLVPQWRTNNAITVIEPRPLVRPPSRTFLCQNYYSTTLLRPPYIGARVAKDLLNRRK